MAAIGAAATDNRSTYVVVMREVQGCHWQPLELGPTKNVDSRLLWIPALSPRCRVSIIEGLEPEWSNLNVLITNRTEICHWKCITENYEGRTLNFWSCMSSQLGTYYHTSIW